MPSAGDADPAARACGDDLVTVAVADVRRAQALAEAMRASGEWLEAVAGYRSVVGRFDNGRDDLDEMLVRIEALLETVGEQTSGTPATLDVPVSYGGGHGPDLEAVCEALGMSRADFVEAHTGGDHAVELLGFTPGFAYVGGFDAAGEVARLDEPRQRVEAGSVGVAAGRTGLYSLPGPGGWPIVGRTPMKLFDAGADTPFRLEAGMRIRFREIDHKAFEDFDE